MRGFFATVASRRSARPKPVERAARATIEGLESRMLLATHFLNPGQDLQSIVNTAVAGDVVHLNAGSHTVPATVNVKPGVTIEGSGQANTTLKAAAGVGLVLRLNDSMTINGNQAVRDITFDGNGRTTSGAVDIAHRHNVSVLNCTFNNFGGTTLGVYGAGWNGAISDRVNGIDFGFLTFNNSGPDNGADPRYGVISIGTTNDAKIHDSVINSPTLRAYGIKFDFNAAHADQANGEGGFNFGLKIYNNNIAVNADFAIELFNVYASNNATGAPSEIYNNVMNKCVSLGGQKAGERGFSWSGDGVLDMRVHHNTFNAPADNPMTLECQGSDIEFDHNYVKNPGTNGIGLWSYGAGTRTNYFFHHNIFDAEGTVGGTHKALYVTPNDGISNLNFYNNTMIGLSAGMDLTDNVQSAQIRNNVYTKGREGGFLMFLSANSRNITFTNNLWGDNGAWYGASWGSGAIRNDGATNFVNTGNFPDVLPGLTRSGNRPNPFFVPTAGGNLADKGTTSGLPAYTSVTYQQAVGANAGSLTDPKHTYVGSVPDIGAFEAVGSTTTLTNVATGGTATANSQNAPNEGAAQAFDGNNNTKWLAFAPTGYLQYQFGGTTAHTVTEYRLTSANDAPARDPKNWTLQGSNDGSGWANLDSRGNQAFANRLQTNTYAVATTGSYRYYRLNVTANNGSTEAGGGGIIQLAELQLMAGASTPTVPGAPGSLAATATSTSQVNLTWADNSNNEAGFTIERATNNAFSAGLTSATVGANATSYSATGLAASTTYYFRVRATNAAGASANSNTASATTQGTPAGVNPYASVQAESANASSGITVYGTIIGNFDAGDWLRYDSVNFGTTGGNRFNVRIATGSTGGQLEVRLGSTTGTLVGTLNVASTGGWDTYTDQFVNLNQTVTGNQTLFLVGKTGGGIGNLDHFSFAQASATLANVATSANGSGSASSNPIATEGVGNLFDANAGTKWIGSWAGGTGATWAQFSFSGSGFAVKQYKLTSANDDYGRHPSGFQLVGSNDASFASSTVLDTRSGQTYGGAGTLRTYDIANTTVYKYYRLVVTGLQAGNDNMVQLADLQLLA
jgi:hypothetical protein